MSRAARLKSAPTSLFGWFLPPGCRSETGGAVESQIEEHPMSVELRLDGRARHACAVSNSAPPHTNPEVSDPSRDRASLLSSRRGFLMNATILGASIASAAPLAIVGTARAHSAYHDAVASQIDPMFSAIERHRSAFFEYIEFITDVPSGDHNLKDEGPEYEQLYARQNEAAIDLTNITPTSIEGCLALLQYVHEFNRRSIQTMRAHKVFSDEDMWPEKLVTDEERDAWGNELELPFPYWLMDNIRSALIELVGVEKSRARI